ncbi:MAG TPA: hypothetical protein VM513_03530 [Kofleriaceae bacterium]|jgi:hypothetical protein|nr:hypothetical protein [Kofleriaceae bacterium]
MKKELPVIGVSTPAQAQRERAGLAVRPVRGGSRPEFPTRGELARASLLATGLAGVGKIVKFLNAVKKSPPAPKA